MSKKIKISDIQGLLNLFTDATTSITDLVEELNHRIINPPFFKNETPIQQLLTGISGFVFNTIRLSTELIGKGIHQSLNELPPALDFEIPFEHKATVLSVLNGIIGDYLHETNNALAIPMQLKLNGHRIEHLSRDYPNPKNKILLMVHGSCMNDELWTYREHNHGEALAAAKGYSLLYLYYNSGQHISTNGQDLSILLEQLVNHWAVPIHEIHLIAHSMGGLVSRSAAYYGEKEQRTWTKKLTKMVFLGTPHHGAPLERLGNHIGQLIENTPYLKPFARLPKLRSSGITDLRFGNVVEADWAGTDRFRRHKDKRSIVPLPDNIACYTIAGTIAGKKDEPEFQQLGDGLVTLNSALGQHKDSKRSLHFKKKHSMVAYKTNHLELLSSQEVFEQIKEWLD